MFKHFPDMMRVFLDASVHTNLKEANKVLNFDEIRKLAQEWVDELEKRFG